MLHYIRNIFYSTLILLFIGCSGKPTFLLESKQDRVLKHIQNYVVDTKGLVPPPQTVDYEILGLNSYILSN